MPIYTTLVVVAEHALAAAHGPAKNQIATAASASLGQHRDVLCERSLALAASPGRARDSTEDIPDRPFTPTSILETYFRQRGRDAWRRRPPRRHAQP
jgi:hypothetical protein